MTDRVVFRVTEHGLLGAAWAVVGVAYLALIIVTVKRADVGWTLVLIAGLMLAVFRAGLHLGAAKAMGDA